MSRPADTPGPVTTPATVAGAASAAAASHDAPALPTPPATGRPLVLVSWNGQATPLACLLLDQAPQFELLLFDYSGRATPSPRQPVALCSLPGGQGVAPDWAATLLSERTECKGDIYQALARELATREAVPAFVGLVDDDVLLSVGDLNRLLHLGRNLGLHVFSPALSHDSVYTHRWSLRLPHRVQRAVPWVEVMMPVYDGGLFMAAAPHFAGNVSSWGIDKYLVPTLQQLTGKTRCAIVDAVMATHVRPITSGMTTYRHGLTAGEEAARMKALCQALVRQHRPALEGGPWWRQTFRQRHVRTRWQQLVYGLGRPIRRWLDAST